MEWSTIWLILCISWILLLSCDFLFAGGARGGRVGKTVASFFSGFKCALLEYEVLYASTTLLLQLYVNETVSPPPLSLVPYALTMYFGGVVGVCYGVGLRHDKAGTYRKTVIAILSEADDIREVIIRFLGIYDSDPNDVSNELTMNALMQISQERTQLGLAVKEVLQGLNRLPDAQLHTIHAAQKRGWLFRIPGPVCSLLPGHPVRGGPGRQVRLLRPAGDEYPGYHSEGRPLSSRSQ